MCHLNGRPPAQQGAGLRFWHLMKSPGCAFCTENDYMGDGIRSERHCDTSAKRKLGASGATKRNPEPARALDVNCDF